MLGSDSYAVSTPLKTVFSILFLFSFFPFFQQPKPVFVLTSHASTREGSVLTVNPHYPSVSGAAGSLLWLVLVRTRERVVGSLVVSLTSFTPGMHLLLQGHCGNHSKAQAVTALFSKLPEFAHCQVLCHDSKTLADFNTVAVPWYLPVTPDSSQSSAKEPVALAQAVPFIWNTSVQPIPQPDKVGPASPCLSGRNLPSCPRCCPCFSDHVPGSTLRLIVPEACVLLCRALHFLPRVHL